MMIKLKNIEYRILNRIANHINPYYFLNRRINLFMNNDFHELDWNGIIFKEDLMDNCQTFLKTDQLQDKKFMDSITRDIVKCYIVYGITPDEYFLHNLNSKNINYRESILSRQLKDKICIKKMGKDMPYLYQQLKDKWLFYELAKPFFKREVCKVDENDYKEIEAFCSKHSKFIAKPRNRSCGIGVHSVDMKLFDNSARKVFEYYKNLNGNKWIFEEYINQSAEMAAWHPTSVNTIRIPSIKTKQGPIIILPLFRVGKNGNFVDNCHNDGGFMSVPNAQTGIIESDGVDVYTNHFEHHINSKIKFKGWQVPRWNELIQTAKELHMSLPEQHKYIGFDFALTDKGWVVVEGNWGNFPHQICLGKGIRKEFEHLMNS